MNIDPLVAGIHHRGTVSGLTHDFYRYPARFSPEFARAAIEAFTVPGDTVLDPFVGGSTTLVEALALGRNGVGVDISELAVFLGKAKTTLLPPPKRDQLKAWLGQTLPRLSPRLKVKRHDSWDAEGYQLHLPWTIRKITEQALNSAETLSGELQTIARCMVLKTAQWALDCKERTPTAEEFREHLADDAHAVLEGLAKLYGEVSRLGGSPATIEVHNRSSEDLQSLDSQLLQQSPAKLVVTSPPYPGVHVLYHRWQVSGRRETAAPFWIANCLDGQGASFYTFSARGNARHEELYFDKLCRIFDGLRSVVRHDAYIVQLVGFSNPTEQLPQYLSAMSAAGFEETVRGSEQAEKFWRLVPNRKWYANLSKESRQTHEVLLIHRPG